MSGLFESIDISKYVEKRPFISEIERYKPIERPNVGTIGHVDHHPQLARSKSLCRAIRKTVI